MIQERAGPGHNRAMPSPDHDAIGDAFRRWGYLRADLDPLGRLTPLRGSVGGYRSARAGVGPAVVGVLRPRIVTPSDFETRFSEDERALILAHERTHLRRGDHIANAVACTIPSNPAPAKLT